MKPKALHRAAAAAIAAPLALSFIGAAPALAGRPAPVRAEASCSATPSPVPVGSPYTLAAWGLPAGQMVNVYVSDSVGTNWTSAMVDGAGRIEVPGHGYFAGTSTVSIKSTGRKAATVASCSFQVV